MKKYRRIEITAFRRRITIVSGDSEMTVPENEVIWTNDADAKEMIEPEPGDGPRVLILDRIDSSPDSIS